MRWLAWVLATSLMLIAGCDSAPATVSPPDRANLKPTADSGVAYVAVIGDTYSSGSSYGGQGANGWPLRATALLREQGVEISPVVAARDGSGYFDHSSEGGVRFVDQVRAAVGERDKLVILFGSLNDRATTPEKLDKLGKYVQQTLAEIVDEAPKSKILVIGPVWGVSPTPPPGVAESRDAIRTQALASGAAFVDPIADGWFTDHPEMLSSYGGRVNDAGHQYLAEKLAPLIAQQLNR